MTRKPFVLVVEDQRRQRESLEALLAKPEPEFIEKYRTGPFEVETARSGAGALAQLAAHLYDVVILDLSLPREDGGMDEDVDVGFEVLRHVPAFPSSAAIITTVHDRVPNITKAFKGGVIDFLSKDEDPGDEITYQTIVRAYQRVIGGRKAKWQEMELEESRVCLAARLRRQRDEFTNLASSVLVKIDDGLRNANRVLQNRFGFDAASCPNDELASCFNSMDKAVRDGVAEFGRLRDKFPISLEREKADINEELRTIVSQFEPLAAHCGARLDPLKPIPGNGFVLVFLQECRDIWRMMLFAAIKRTAVKPNVVVAVEGVLGTGKVAVSVVFADSPALQETTRLTTQNAVDSVKIFASSMGGSANMNRREDGLQEFRVEIPDSV